MIIDFHSHILPQIDDGSKSVEMSLKMLDESARQGVECCIATPHFYGNKQPLERFLEKRDLAWKQIQDGTPVKVILGSETAYFPGISHADGLEKLRIQNTDLLLLEMPYAPWDDFVILEVEKLAKSHHLVLAHLERFMAFRSNVKYVEWLQEELPVEVQLNAESFLKWSRRMQIRRHIHKTYLLGSDMHNTAERAPNLAACRCKIDADTLEKTDSLGKRLLFNRQ